MNKWSCISYAVVAIFIAKQFLTLYQSTTVPYCTGERCVTPILQTEDLVKYSVYVGCGRTHETASFWLAGNFQTPYGSNRLENDHLDVSLDLPACSTGIFIHVAGEYQGYTFTNTRSQISQIVQTPKNAQKTLKYLLSGRIKQPAKPALVLAAPREILVGPVQVSGNLSVLGLLKLGRNNWFRNKNEDYLPEIYIDMSQSPTDDFLPLDDMRTLRIRYAEIPWRKWCFMNIILWQLSGLQRFGVSEFEQESLKLFFSTNSVWLISASFVISLLHSIFEIFAMKHAHQTMNLNIKDSERVGMISTKGLLAQVVLETLIFLWYLSTGESHLVTVIVGMHILHNSYMYIKALSSKKAFGASTQSDGYQILSKASYLLKPLDCLSGARLSLLRASLSSEQFEAVVLNSLIGLSLCLILPTAAYQLLFVAHESIWALGLKLLAYIGYFGGLIVLSLQVYMNFYFKSVAVLSWPALTYKFINTIIDDIFSFLIRMPAEHKATVFQDDLIFIISMYQWYIYRKKTKVD